MEYTTAKVSVWWDLQNCDILKDFDPHRVAHNICSALVRMNYHGPVSIFCYGDTTEIPESIQDALTTTGIPIKHVPDGTYKRILVDMMLWAMDNPAPANCLLISDDVNFSYAIHQLLMKRYNILVAQSQNPSAPLIAAAKIVWLCTTLLAGGPPLSNEESQQLVRTSQTSIATHSDSESTSQTSIATHSDSESTPETPIDTHSEWTSESEQELAAVLLAINSLKNDKILPTEENITETIRHGDAKHRNTYIEYALVSAMKQHMVVKQNLGSLTLYLGKNDKLWECLSPVGGRPNQYSQEIWDAIQLFLTSPDGSSAIMQTKCRYEAAIVIKNLIKNRCFKDIVLGHAFRILNMLIVYKHWIDLSALSNWQPITITVKPAGENS